MEEHYCETRKLASGWIAVVTFKTLPLYITTPFVSGSVMPHAEICDKDFATQREAADDAIRWCNEHGITNFMGPVVSGDGCNQSGWIVVGKSGVN